MDYINLNLQPCDATRYIVVITEGHDCPYVVIGAGDSCSGMYVPHHHINTVPSLLNAYTLGRAHGASVMNDSPTVDYQVSKLGGNRHTAFVGMIMAWLWRTSPYLMAERAQAIIGPMAASDGELLSQALLEEGRLIKQGGSK